MFIKNKKKYYSLLIMGTLLLCLFILFSSILPTFDGQYIVVKAEDPTEGEYLNWNCGKYDIYTDNNTTPDGIEIKDYADYYGETLQINEANFTVLGEDRITDFVPRELFEREGKTFYIGRKYGFLVDTYELVENGKVSHSGLFSIVVLFTVNTGSNMVIEKCHMRSTVAMLFQGMFCNVSKDTTWLDTFDSTAVSDEDVEYNYKQSVYTPLETEEAKQNLFFDVVEEKQQDSYVIAVPTYYYESKLFETSEGYEIRQCNKYYLEAPLCYVSLYNEHHANPMNGEYYDPILDNGAFFTQMDVEYEGNFVETGGTDWVSVGNLAVETLSLSVGLFENT